MRDQDATVLVNFDSKEEAAGLLEQAYTELGKAYYEGGFERPPFRSFCRCLTGLPV